MQTLFAILGDSFIIWSRNISLIYILLLMTLVLSLLFPQGETPSLEWRWLTLIGIFLLIVSAFMAGWFSMIRKACIRYFEQSREAMNPTDIALEGFTLFRGFLPGVSQYFVPVTLGFLIQGLPLVPMFFLLRPLWEKNAPLLETHLNQVNEGTANLEAMILQLPPAQQMALSEFLLALLFCGLAYAVFWLLTMLWPAFLILYRDNPLKACWRSLMQFFKDPFLLIAIWLLFLMSQFMLRLITAASPGLIGALFHLLGLMLEVYMTILLFVYAYRVVGKPVEASEELAEETSIGEPPEAE